MVGILKVNLFLSQEAPYRISTRLSPQLLHDDVGLSGLPPSAYSPIFQGVGTPST